MVVSQLPSPVTQVQYLASIALLGLGGVIALANVRVLIMQLLGKASPSVAPLLGGIFLFAGALLFPGGALRSWAVLGLFIDYGCVPYLILLAVSMRKETRRFAAEKRILGIRFESDGYTGEISVYPGDDCIYKWAARDGHSSGSTILKVDAYLPDESLRLSIQDTVISLRLHEGRWQLDAEGCHNLRHSLEDATFTDSAVNPSFERTR